MHYSLIIQLCIYFCNGSHRPKERNCSDRSLPQFPSTSLSFLPIVFFSFSPLNKVYCRLSELVWKQEENSRRNLLFPHSISDILTVLITPPPPSLPFPPPSLTFHHNSTPILESKREERTSSFLSSFNSSLLSIYQGIFPSNKIAAPSNFVSSLVLKRRDHLGREVLFRPSSSISFYLSQRRHFQSFSTRVKYLSFSFFPPFPPFIHCLLFSLFF